MSSTNINKKNKRCLPPYGSFYSIFHIIISLFAIYLSFKCNKGFKPGSFIVALLCPHIYIIYEFAISDNFCGIKSIV